MAWESPWPSVGRAARGSQGQPAEESSDWLAARIEYTATSGSVIDRKCDNVWRLGDRGSRDGG